MEHYPTKQSTVPGNNKREQCEMHSLFYTVCQAAFYVMCFRGKEALQYYRESVDYHKHIIVSEVEVDDIPFADPQHINISEECWNKLQFITFGICIFVSANVLEGVNMSLLSKTLPNI